jgi:tetratricopeptide (TPR) repeat protein
MTLNPSLKQTPSQTRLVRLIGPTLFLVAMLCAYLGYMKGFTADWNFDDTRALASLSKVKDTPTAIEFILEDRRISLFDRPLSMATFLVNVNDWPKPQAFRHINTLIHLLNALLLAFVALKIARLIPRLAPHATGFAFTLAAIWMLHPFLASTSLLVIQRMALLSGTFTLLGLLTYLHGRAMLNARPRAGFTWMTLGVGFATLIGTLAKENAALTPLFIGVLEFSVLSLYAPVSHRYLAAWKTLFFIGPVILLFAYITVRFDAINHGYAIRPFTMGERLLSESVILLEYVRQILIPDVFTMGPFQDDTYRTRGLSLVTVFSSLFWVGLTILVIAFRKRTPALTFAVLFFLVGHILESGIFSLELYFEHRNYIPSLGILGAVTAIAWSHQAHWPKAATIAFAAGMTVLLWQTTSVWGNRAIAPLQWEKAHPTSTRAAQTLATYYQRRDDIPRAAQIILKRYEANPLDAGLALPTFITQCFTEDHDKRAEIVRRITQDAPRLYFSSAALKVLHSIVDIYQQGKCNILKPEEAIQISRGLLKNPGFQHSASQYSLLFSIARTQEVFGDKNAAIETKKMAFRVEPILKAATTIFFQLKEAGRDKDAIEFLVEARALAPEHEEHYRAWEQSLKK